MLPGLKEGTRELRRETAVLYGLVFLAVPVAIALVTLPSGVAVSNAAQTVSALVSALVAAAWLARPPHRTVHALAALGCAGWALSNLLWYAAFMAVGTDLVPGVADAGFLGFFFFLAAMLVVSVGRGVPPARVYQLTAVVLAGTLVLVLMVAFTGDPLLYVLLYLLPAVVCSAGAVRFRGRAPVFSLGMVLYCIAMAGNAVREAWSLTSPVAFLNGPVIMAAFPLVVIGAAALARGSE
jgi:hypothetical protein